MKKVYISKNYRDRFTASSKAKYDCENIIQKCGYKNIGLKCSNIQNLFWGRIWTLLSNLIAFLRMPFSSIIFLQYPVNFYNWQVRIAKWKNNKVITIIHDIDFLRGSDDEFKYKKALESSDVLIVHTKKMQEWCLNNLNCKRIVILELFDYLYDNEIIIKHKDFDKNNISIAFAGNLGKSDFLDKIKTTSFTINLFGIGVEKRRLNNCCIYKGCFSPSELNQHLDSAFGLVWDGTSLDECTGINGEYLKFICPHKLSMYISAGIPVIVWKKSAMAEFVKNMNIGIVIDSLQELNMLSENLNRQEYDRILINVRKIQNKVINGCFLYEILKKIEK